MKVCEYVFLHLFFYIILLNYFSDKYIIYGLPKQSSMIVIYITILMRFYFTYIYIWRSASLSVLTPKNTLPRGLHGY